MRGQPPEGTEWAALTVWGVVNAVCLLQAIGFLSRIATGSRSINQVLGYAIVVLALPAGIALVAFIRAGAGWLQWAGPLAFICFVAFMIAVEYVWRVEFRTPPNYPVLVPYLVLFFGSILLMGLPMFEIDRRLWLVTAASATFLLVSMALAMRKGVG